jgi:hypothetical protein
MARFRTRRLQPQDEGELNDRFVEIVQKRCPGYSRSLELMRWLWYHPPGGPADSWVIEAENPDGSWKIIGHHGLCPVRFTLGKRDLLCAKTFNTFLLPEFRSRFLYIRFERQCLDEALSRYDVVYSCGPGTFRLRKPLGYGAEDTWISLEHGAHYLDLTTRLFTRFVNRFPRAPWIQMARAWAAASVHTAPKPSFEWIEYSPAQAMQSPFFADFWQQARTEAGMSPRRDAADLAWRYWLRPESSFVTLVHSWEGDARAYCIVETSNPFLYSLFDIFVTPMRPDLLDAALQSLFIWCARRGALTLSFTTTVQGQPPELMRVFLRRMRAHPLTHFRQPNQISYCLSPELRASPASSMPSWNATELLIPR